HLQRFALLIGPAHNRSRPIGFHRRAGMSDHHNSPRADDAGPAGSETGSAGDRPPAGSRRGITGRAMRRFAALAVALALGWLIASYAHKPNDRANPFGLQQSATEAGDALVFVALGDTGHG